ncbi:MAG TPA: glycoside hydrolase family 43 protein [Pyrinomonadaceae bacterium]
MKPFGPRQSARAAGLLAALALCAAAAAGPSVRAQRAPRAGAAASSATYANPVFDEDFPDPTVIRASDGWFYAYATTTNIGGRVYHIQAARSRDLVSWERLPDVLPAKPAWSSQHDLLWAPDVHQRGRTFYLYFSNRLNDDLAARFKRENNAESSKEDVFCLGVATARLPIGPFTDSGRPLKCGLSFVNIDPMAFDDPRTGRKYLFWGSGFQPIRVQELAADRLSFKAGSRPVELVAASKDLPYQTLIEGAWVVYRGGFYYLFYSGENCCHGPLQQIKYAVLVARARQVEGPYQTLAQARGGRSSAILERSDAWIAPGHNSIVEDDAGQSWIVYHAIDVKRPYMTATLKDDRNVRRVMLLDRLAYRGGWPFVEGGGKPSRGPRPAPFVRRGRPPPRRGRE